MSKDKVKFKELVFDYYLTAVDAKLAIIRVSLLDKKYDDAREQWKNLLNELENLQKINDLADRYE